ncbi:hypothetical protein EG328_011846 [Venturia inaequalis]|uniref:Glutathione transferase n=1 Tax=Venturia inaequalis TaxID=5025 RepID=A0A8H3V365_VENIN|nr:hypothetical protein EG328_011846 [Venturia inaequalis]
MDHNRTTLPPTSYHSGYSDPLVPLLQQHHALPAQYGPGPTYHALNAHQPLQPGVQYSQQHYIPQRQQLQTHIPPNFAVHPSQARQVQLAHHPSPPHLLQQQQNQHHQHAQHPPVQHHQQQQQFVSVHNPGIAIQHQQPIAPAQVDRSKPQLQLEVNAQPEQSQYEHKPNAHLEGLKLVADPPELELWRQKLFDVDDMTVVSEDEYDAQELSLSVADRTHLSSFQIYFPHVDNVYSHRSTQKYKKKPFISQYWNCRLKGRPAGTAKSDDPNKKKRKRVARERDLCDVKIKITEYLPGATRDEIQNHLSQQPRREAIGLEQLVAMVDSSPAVFWNTGPAGYGQITRRFYTLQRVNGTGPSGREEGGGPHRHGIEDSDKIKKNSVERWMARSGKEVPKRKAPVVLEKKSYHTKATGAALATVKKHSKEHSLKLYGGCFCPFVQRVWISLEAKKLNYQYIELDPYKKPDWYLKLNPRGLIPTLQHDDWCCGESTVLMEYLEDLNMGQPLFPSDPRQKAHCRLWTDHINRHIIPAFYHYIQAQTPDLQTEKAQEFKAQINKLVEAADQEGPFFLGPSLGFVDVQFAPWVIRLNKVLKPYRGWPDPEPGSRFGKWVKAIEDDECVRATTSTDELYLDSYERYADI